MTGEVLDIYRPAKKTTAGKESACNAGDLGSIPGLERPWRRERLPTSVFLPGEFHGLYSLWGRKESDTMSDFHTQRKQATYF